MLQEVVEVFAEASVGAVDRRGVNAVDFVRQAALVRALVVHRGPVYARGIFRHASAFREQKAQVQGAVLEVEGGPLLSGHGAEGRMGVGHWRAADPSVQLGAEHRQSFIEAGGLPEELLGLRTSLGFMITKTARSIALSRNPKNIGFQVTPS